MSCASKIFFSISSSPCLHFAFISWGKVFPNQNTKVKPLKTNEFWNILIGLCSSVRYRNMGLNCPGCEIVSFCLCLFFLFILIPLNTAYVQCTRFEKLSFQLSGIVFSDTHTHTLKKKRKKTKRNRALKPTKYSVLYRVEGRMNRLIFCFLSWPICIIYSKIIDCIKLQTYHFLVSTQRLNFQSSLLIPTDMAVAGRNIQKEYAFLG